MYTEPWKNLTQVFMHLFTTPETCHRTTLWNSELVQVMKVMLFPQKVDGFV